MAGLALPAQGNLDPRAPALLQGQNGSHYTSIKGVERSAQISVHDACMIDRPNTMEGWLALQLLLRPDSTETS